MKTSKEQSKHEFDELSNFEKNGSLSNLIIEKSNVAIKSKTLEGIITTWNHGAEMIYGYSNAEIIGKHISILVPPNRQNEINELIELLRKGENIQDFQTQRIKKNGEIIDVSLNIVLIENSAGKPIGICTIDQDITNLRMVKKDQLFQNEEKEKRADELLMANKELVFQNEEKEKRADELVIANKELLFQNEEKEKRAEELVIANEELLFQSEEKEKRADELVIANKELLFQNEEKEKRADELVIANKELEFQQLEKGKRAAENKKLEAFSNSLLLTSQYSRSLIEASKDPLFTIDIDGKIMDLNEATMNVTGFNRKKLIGTDFINYFTEPQKAKIGYEEIFIKGSVADFPLTIKDHKLTDVLFNGAVYKSEDGKVLGAVVVARDITEQKIIEKQFIEAKVFAEMATSIAEKAKYKAEEATNIAENAVKSKQQFLSNMSHEIRTPMNAIIGFTKVVLKTELTDKQKEYLLAIKVSGDALIVLINDILDLAKVDAGKMTFEETPFKLTLSLNSMLHIFDTKIQEKNLTLIKEYDETIPEVLIGDPVRLHQIILNLVSNAVKFTTDGSIKVEVTKIKEDDDKVSIKFAVSDTGIGISTDKLNFIFDDFQQASSNTSRLFGGTGLGLAIVKQLVEAQGGSMKVISEIDKGSAFSFVLDFQKTTENLTLESEDFRQDTDMKQLKILVVEDMPLNQLLMKTLLDDFGFENHIAANGKIAIEKLETNQYDIILMDLQMPEMNGFEATNYIRKTLNSSIPIIALTADVTTVDLAKCTAVGMNDYISKPVDERLLYAKIISLVKKNRSQLDTTEEVKEAIKQIKCINLDYLTQRTKSNPKMMTEMITAYLEQTPPLIAAMKTSFESKDWKLLYASIHKMIPSFSIMGISSDFEQMAKKVQEFASLNQETNSITEMILELEKVLIQSCEELHLELAAITSNH